MGYDSYAYYKRLVYYKSKNTDEMCNIEMNNPLFIRRPLSYQHVCEVYLSMN